jgi:hypothetical protein
VDDRRFDELSRRVGALALPRLPRRGVLGFLGIASLAGTLGVALEPQPAEAAKCKKEGKKCDKKKCKKKDKKCCCNKLKCKNGRCKEKGPTCPTAADFDFDVETFNGGDSFNNPFGITTDPDGHFFVTDTDNFRIVAFNQNGNFRKEFGESGQGDEEFEQPLGIGFNERSNDNLRLYVVDRIQNSNDRRIRDFEGDVDANDFGDQKNNLGDDTGDPNSNPIGVTVAENNRNRRERSSFSIATETSLRTLSPTSPRLATTSFRTRQGSLSSRTTTAMSSSMLPTLATTGSSSSGT